MNSRMNAVWGLPTLGVSLILLMGTASAANRHVLLHEPAGNATGDGRFKWRSNRDCRLRALRQPRAGNARVGTRLQRSR